MNMFSNKKVLSISFSLAALFALLTGCGKEEAAVEDAETSITIKSTNWDFDQEVYKIPAGKQVAIHLVNEEGHHGIAIKGTNVDIKGEGSTVVNLEPGEYEIVCNIICGTGHEEMISTLVVE